MKDWSNSDRSKPREIASISIGAFFGLLILLFAFTRESNAPGPLSLPHQRAGVACKNCHDQSSSVASISTSCTSCHASSKHVSTRPPHQALMDHGDLVCTTCHSAHGDTQGISFESDGTFTRFGFGQTQSGALDHATPKTTVPLLAKSVCVGCHDLDRVADPAAHCFVRSNGIQPTASTCFDEHRSILDPNAKNRLAAWESAAEVTRKSPWIQPASRDRRPFFLVLLPALLAGLAFFGNRFWVSRKKVEPTSAPVLVSLKRRLPQINVSTCLGCYACVGVCPFDVIEVKRYVAVVTKPNDCCGVLSCQTACPNGSLTIHEGELQAGLPRVNDELESLDAPNVFLAGDLTGMPLIRNAIDQGTRVIETIAKRAKISPNRDNGIFDVGIIGAGPAGLSAALAAKKKELRYVVFEQATVASSIRSFPRNKLVLDQASSATSSPALWLQESTKEELLLQWSRVLRRQRIVVRERERVLAAERDGDTFVIRTEATSVRVKYMVIAIGRRGTPRATEANVDDGPESKISYSLADARSFEGQSILVVGLRDSAIEAAIALSNQPGTRVTISYRGSEIRRGKTRNVEALEAVLKENRLRLVFESQLVHVGMSTATLQTKEGTETITNDAVLVLLGGTLGSVLLDRIGVKYT